MTQLPQKPFLRWYARADLDAPKSRPITRWTVRALGLVVAMLIVSGTVAFWIPALQTARLEKSPLAKSLWVGQNAVKEKILTPEKLALLREKILAELPPSRPVDIQPFTRMKLSFQPKGKRFGTTWYGRTIEQADPILSRLEEQPLPKEMGIVPTRALLTNWLGFNADETPETLTVRFSDSHPWKTLPVLFVAEIKLPNQIYFFIRRSDLIALDKNSQDLQLRAKGIYLGPITEDWPTKSRLNHDSELAAFFSQQAIETPDYAETLPDPSYRLISENESLKTKIAWDALALKFREQMQIYLDAEMPDLKVNPEALTKLVGEKYIGQVVPEPPKTSRFDKGVFEFAEVRVQELDDLKPTALGCRKAGYPADETLVEQVDQVYQVGQLLFVATLSITLSLLGIAGLIMYIMQKLRCELKIPEIGMLKAMGISGPEFQYLIRVQAAVLWRRSFALGGSLAVCGVAGIAWWCEITRRRSPHAVEVFIGLRIGDGSGRVAGDLAQP